MIRDQIDQIDRRLVGDLNRRAELACRLIDLKKMSGRAVLDPDRERLVLEKVSQCSEGPLGDQEIIAIFEEVMRACRTLQETRDERLTIKADASLFSDPPAGSPLRDWLESKGIRRDISDAARKTSCELFATRISFAGGARSWASIVRDHLTTLENSGMLAAGHIDAVRAQRHWAEEEGLAERVALR